jgi:hypothetical protein
MVDFSREISDRVGDFSRLDLGDHLPIVGRRAKEFGLESKDSGGHSLAKSVTLISGRFGIPTQFKISFG